MSDNQAFNPVQFAPSVPPLISNSDGREQEGGQAVAGHDVDVRWLVRFLILVRPEVEAAAAMRSAWFV